MLDLRRLAMLREVAARGTVTAAAEALGYTTSAVSQQLGVLEREVGTAVLERRGRNVILTAAGRALVTASGAVFAAAERALSDAQAAASKLSGRITVGTFQTVGATVIPVAFASIQEAAPELELHFTQWSNDGLRDLRLGHLDICVDHDFDLLPPPDTSGIEGRTILTEPVYLAVPKAIDRGPDPSSYADDVWVVSRTDYGDLVRAICHRHGFEPTVRYHTDDLEVTLQLVAAGVAVGVLPRLAARDVPDRVTLHPIPHTERRLRAYTREGTAHRPALALVLDHLEQAGAAV